MKLIKLASLSLLILWLIIGCRSKKERNTIQVLDSTTIAIRCVEDSLLADSIQYLNCREFDTVTNKTLSKGPYWHNIKNDGYYRYGWHTFYNQDNTKKKLRFILDTESPFEEWADQFIEFDTSSNIIKERSSYLKISPGNYDTFNINQEIPISLEINHLGNTQEIYDKYKLLVLDNLRKEVLDTVYSDKPSFLHYVKPSEIGNQSFNGNILFFVTIPNEPDSLEVVDWPFEIKYYIRK